MREKYEPYIYLGHETFANTEYAVHELPKIYGFLSTGSEP